MKKVFLLPLMFLTFCGYSVAEESAVDELFRVMSIEKQMLGGFEAMLPVINQMTQQYNLDSAAKTELEGIFRAWFKEDVDRTKIINLMKKQYITFFTDEEMKEISKFYQTPVGQKFLDESTKMMQYGAQLGMQEAQSKQAILLQRLKPFFEKQSVAQ